MAEEKEEFIPQLLERWRQESIERHKHEPEPIREVSYPYNFMGNMLPIVNDWGDVTGYAPKPPDYWEEPGY